MINTSTFPAVSRKIPRMGENTRYLCCHSSAAISSLFVILARYSWGLYCGAPASCWAISRTDPIRRLRRVDL